MYKRTGVNKKLPLKISIAGFILLVILLAGCAKASTPAPSTVVPTAPSENTAPTETLETIPTESITEIQTEEASDSNCISCHMDKEQLISTADPVEEKESESSGEG